jgi:ferrochelatase
LARKIQDFWQQDGQPTRLLFSFHGLPQAFIDNGDPYFDRCRETAMRVAAILGLESDAWAYAFQSRLGSQPWIKPYTDELLQTWGAQGISTVHTVCPGFSADCLETLEEMALRNRDVFLQAGGKHYEYIPALNADEDHIELMEALIEPTLRT